MRCGRIDASGLQPLRHPSLSNSLSIEFESYRCQWFATVATAHVTLCSFFSLTITFRVALLQKC